MNATNIMHHLSELFNMNLNINTTEVTQNEKEIAQNLKETITSFTDCKTYSYDQETTLNIVYESDSSHSNKYNVYYDDNSSEADDEWENKENEKKPYHLTEYSLDSMKEVVAFADATNTGGKRRRSWKTVHNRYRSIPDQAYISRFRKCISQKGTKRQKISHINQLLLKIFLHARELGLPIHDIDIRRWAFKIAHEMNFENFEASYHWLCSFKARYSLVSRRITDIVTRHEIQNYETIEMSEKDFLNDFHELAPNYLASEILNTDQVGIQKEIHSSRTISVQGEKRTYSAVASKKAATHSYTIQPTISLDGKLIGPMYLCLQETNGKAGEYVKKNLLKPKNVVITCSSSGKLTSSLVLYWRDNCLLPSIGKQCLLLSDSYTNQNDVKIYDDLNSFGKKIKRIQISPKTTSDIQPLDQYFNRQIKNFIKRFYNFVALDEIPLNLYERNNIIILISLVHNQLSSVVFERMIKYSWYASGYITENPSPFANINEVCFPRITSHEQCQQDQCIETAFITCSHCNKKLCFEHFFVQYHFH